MVPLIFVGIATRPAGVPRADYADGECSCNASVQSPWTRDSVSYRTQCPPRSRSIFRLHVKSICSFDTLGCRSAQSHPSVVANASPASPSPTNIVSLFCYEANRSTARSIDSPSIPRLTGAYPRGRDFKRISFPDTDRRLYEGTLTNSGRLCCRRIKRPCENTQRTWTGEEYGLRGGVVP